MAENSRSLSLILSIGAAGAALALSGAVVGVGNMLINSTLVPKKDKKFGRFSDMTGAEINNAFGEHDEETNRAILQHRGEMYARRDAWLAQNEAEKVHIISADGKFKLAGFIYRANPERSKWVILLHGYGSWHGDMERMAPYYAEQGYNVFLPDLRCYGDSGGDLVTMGWYDRLDIIGWMNYLIGRFGEGISLVLHGHSMGAATALMVSGETTPDQLRAVISDCAFTNVRELFVDQYASSFKGSPAFGVESGNIMMKLRYGVDFREVSPLEKTAHSSTPTLFIHGTEDSIVRPSMVYELYDACSAQKKDLLIIEGAGHTQADQRDPETYFTRVFSFLDGIA